MACKAQDPGSGRRGRLFNSVKVLPVTLLPIAYTRLELLSTELAEERVRLGSILDCRPVSTRDWGVQLPRIAVTGFHLAGAGLTNFAVPG